MLSLLLVLSGLGRLTSTGLYFETPLLQITVPQKIETNTKDGKEPEAHVTYLISFEGKTYTLLLKKQSFLHPNFLTYSYSKLGALQTESSFIKSHCFYQGRAAEIPRSVVTLSTCSGLRGLLQLENSSYGIEPLESSATYEHMFYEVKNNKIDYSPLKEHYPKLDQSYRILVKPEKYSDIAQSKRTMKMRIFVDKALYDYMGSEIGVATQKVVLIFGLINTMFSQINMTIMLSSLEVWSDKNRISTDGDADEVLQRFLKWKQKRFSQRSNDMAYLLLYKDHPDYVGATYHGTACDPKFAAGIALHPKAITLEAFSVVIAQLLGINLGLTYDDIYNCYCPGSSCIMNPEAIQSHGIKTFSSCSMDGFKQMVSQPEFECLQNQKVSEVILQPKQATCGNGILESGEDCDCGPPEKCVYKKCCNPTACTLIGKAECGTGPCCNAKTCEINERGILCRKSKDMCDFPEFCNGTSEFCVPDVQSANLEPCNNRSAFCLNGICRDPDRQCADLFGKCTDAKGSNYLCAQEVNIQGDKFGNCHGNCNFQFILCGKIVCHWTKSEIIPQTVYDIQYTYLGGHVCVSAHLRKNDRQDNTYVHDGTICGPNQACLGGQCKFVSTFENKSECDSLVKCQGHGVCNSLHNCHCDVGYSPPSCDPTPSSPGGSMDDGYWIPQDKRVLLIKKQNRATPYKNGLFISFFVFLPFLILTAFLVFKWNKLKEYRNRSETVSEGSTTEDSSTYSQS